MTALIKYSVIVALASATGVYSAINLRSGHYDLVSKSVGIWKTWPNGGTSSIDPYTRAHFVAENRFPLSRFDALEFEARVDGEGAPLEADCRYRIAGPNPTARRWSLISVPADPQSDAPATPNTSISSSLAVADATGAIEIALSQTPIPGNWLQPAGDGEQVLLLRLVDPVFEAGRDNLERQPFTVERMDCR